MLILVDYDNIGFAITRLGASHLINRIVSKIDLSDIGTSRHIKIRFYGGWYELQNFTQKAQNLSADLAANFPNVALLEDNQTSVFVHCEMAYSILADPVNHLFHTYRSRGIPSGLKAHHPSTCGCSSPTCPIVSVYSFIFNDICPECNLIKPLDVFYRGEQKLVDTMITSDLIFSSGLNQALAIVSSDDDFWPGIKTTLVNGKKIVHLHTMNRNTPSFYTQTTTNNYIQKQL